MVSYHELKTMQKEMADKYSQNENYRIIIGMGTCGLAAGAQKVWDTAAEELKKLNLDKEVDLDHTGCIGFCAKEPLMEIRDKNKRYIYANVNSEKTKEIIKQHLKEGNIISRWLVDLEGDFFSKQERIVLKNCGNINPENIEEALANGAYLGLGKAVEKLSPKLVREEILNSNLRGRGGAGFPTGLKWKLAAEASGTEKYVICNADEGDPGAFMDRSILEGDPHKLLEGMAIAGYAVGAEQGYIYCRAEYPLAIKRLKRAIKDAEDLGVLGDNIFGSDFTFKIDIRLGAGAFVCGEETALIASIEGRRGEPRAKPPFPADSGLWYKPTVINNVETLANVGEIIRNGSEWFNKIGTEKSSGTKVFALAGKIENNGLVEVPMGTKVGEVIFDIGGGLENDGNFKAAQTGGPSGGCIPIQHLNVPIDYDSLQELGTIMGSGGMIIMDDQTCMVDLAKYFIDFCKDESCGQCTPCRIGTTRMLEILNKITVGKGSMEDLKLLTEMGEKIKDSSFCGLGQTAPNPVLSTIRYFKDEYIDHIKNKHCSSSVCAALFNSPCQNACPANVDIPIYIDLIRQGKYKEAYKVVQEENPLVLVCGRVCYNLCEKSCNRGSMDEPLAIRELKRFVSDYLLEKEGNFPTPEIKEEKDKKIAVVGSGPSGLTAAFYLRKKGYQVTIFEAESEVGGMLALGIPEYRLPKKLLNEEIAVLTTMGVEISVDTKIGEDIKLEDLKDEGYWAVYMAVGAQKDRNLGIEGEDLEGVYSALQMLRDINNDTEIDMKGKKVSVIGGGNAAIDVARNLVRLGAEEVNIIYRRTKEDMPAHREEIEEAEYEKVNIYTQVNPVKIIGENGKVKSLECIKISGGKFDESGRRKPVEIEGSNYTLKTDVVISAVGQSVDDEFNSGKFKIELENETLISVDSAHRTNIPWIFAGGDCVTGPSTVIESIQQGKEAAASIDKYLGGDGQVVEKAERERKLTAPIIEEEKPRIKMPTILLSERKKGFTEVEKGYSADQAVEEASRCLRCDVEEKEEVL
ncbi:NADH-ubiquinone oxidoreductase-F iron-sulfur binding region domain-containing protein [Halanaerobium sp. MA284_MarDTE_T2]|uniref:NADH-ubiquinone oxidoreductase-F iron-sulfur binding region domain-containing protein n=1 Tax=Halanaerobium sp. MA284_MarDTE_T2 TaxID=2183913 RepID=UPI000E18FA4A|nr:NADH-ubiquinone oxidoreductase-F iron-sulfur binding region domain-containing protein [Halanaerobium sp. MA284_MarDTE_T2]RCW48805.1 NADH-quinone oxidoreductase subunit F [Halanaerobium sp. MA284_MarDTE_T2]